MSDRNQALALLVLGFIAGAALWAAVVVLDDADTPEVAQAGLALAAIASNVVTGIAGFMVGRFSVTPPTPQEEGP